MNMRNDWTVGDSETFSDVFYNKEESIQSVKDNFDIRRYYTAEGYDIEINGVTERCLVQTSSNPLRELNDYRKIQCPITADVKRGYYVKYEGTVWIIDTNVANIDGAYLSTRMSRCQYLLRWQNSDGNIIEKWGYSSDQTKYSNGEYGNNVITVGDNQYCILLPIDEDTKHLKRGMRFAVDFEDSDEPDIYKLSNRKVNLNNELYFNRGGTMTITLSYDSLNRQVDRQVTLKDGRMVWICDFRSTNIKNESTISFENNDKQMIASYQILGSEVLRCGIERTYTALFTDKFGNAVTDVDFTWNVNSDFKVSQSVDRNKITLLVSDEELIDSSFLLEILFKNKVAAKKEITVVDLV